MIKIRSKIFLPLVLFLFFTSGCQSSNAVIDVITFEPSDYNVMFFPNNSNSGVKEIYMDALLELKAKYPKAFTDVQTKEKNIDDLQYTIKQDDPTLIIIKNGETIAKLSGDMPKSEIVEKLEMTMTE